MTAPGRPADARTSPAVATPVPLVPAALAPVTPVMRVKRPPATHDAAALMAVALLALYTATGLLGIGGRALSVTYPVGCLLVALLAYSRSPSTYLALTWWLWIVTPMVRRMFDLKYGFHTTSPLLLAPLLATSVSLFTVVRRRHMLRSTAYFPFIMATVALAYAFLIGLIRQSITAASYDLLTWLAPLLFGLHLALEWRRFPDVKRTITASVLVGLIFTSAYGIAQFVHPQMWDVAWVVNAEMLSVGAPVPFMIRVFSTLNAPGPFSVLLVFSLLLGLAAPQRWRYLPLALGLIALILTKGRSAWGAFFLGAVVLQLKQPLRAMPKQWLALLAVFLLAAPAVTQTRVLGVLSKRAATLRNVSEDNSYQNRATFARYAVGVITHNPAGSGLGYLGGASKLVSGSKVGFALDNGPLEVFGLMGWIGGTFYMTALLAIILPILRARKARYDPFTAAAVAAIVALFAASMFGNVFNSVSGFFFWSAVGLATAGRNWATAAEIATRYANHPGLPERVRSTLAPRPSAA